MLIKDQKPFQKRTLPIIRFLAITIRTAPFILILFLVVGSQIAQSEDKSHFDTVENTNCVLSPVDVPILPDTIPGYTQLDPVAQLHVTGVAQVIDLASYSLKITGRVTKPLNLKYDDLRCMPKIQARPTLVCPGFFEDTASWSGVPLKYVLNLANMQEGASHIRLVSADGYATLVPIIDALSDKNFLAYELKNEPIPILHGFPVRAVFPDLQGNKWVKWLVGIEVQ